MRIAYIINSLEGGGAALPVPAVTGLMREAGCQVRLFALSRRDGRAAAALDAAGLDYEVCEVGKHAKVRSAIWLFAQLRKFDPDLIWTSLTQATIAGQIVGALLHRPVVSWQHNAFLKPANEAWLRRMRNLSRFWVADSESVAALTRRRLQLPAERVLVWPLFIAREPTHKRQRTSGLQPFRLGSLGRLHPDKGYDVLIDALALLARARPEIEGRLEVIIGGEGDERAALAARAQALGVRHLRLPGFQESPAEFLSNLDGYVQPSRAEGLCIAAHEAMAAGLPVIVSAVGEMPLTVRSGRHGLVVRPDDPDALASAISDLLRDRDRAARMGEEARKHVVSKFSQQAFLDAGLAAVEIARRWGR